MNGTVNIYIFCKHKKLLSITSKTRVAHGMLLVSSIAKFLKYPMLWPVRSNSNEFPRDIWCPTWDTNDGNDIHQSAQLSLEPQASSLVTWCDRHWFHWGTKEIDKVMVMENLNNEHHHKLDVMYRQLESKNKVLGELNNDIMKCWNLRDIKREVQESNAITTNIIEYKARIESVKRPVNTSKIVRLAPDSTEAISTVARPCLPQLTLPTFKGNVTRWTSFWDSYNSAIHSNS